MPRCPNGTRKNKITGECETRKNKGKEEEEIEEIEEIKEIEEKKEIKEIKEKKPKKTKKAEKNIINKTKKKKVFEGEKENIIEKKDLEEGEEGEEKEDIIEKKGLEEGEDESDNEEEEGEYEESDEKESIEGEEGVIDDLEDDDEDLNLKEKEKKEYYNNLKKTSNSKTDFLHPSLGNPYLGKQISLRKEFETLKYNGEIKDKHDIKMVSDMICKNSEFELLPHQLFVKQFISNQTPYKSILLYHGLGSGKTCSAIGISEEFRNYTKQTGTQSRIFIIASPNVQDNFKLQLFDETKLVNTNNIWSLNTCVGKNILKEINPTNDKMEKNDVIDKANAIINNDYRFKGYFSFATYIERKINTDDKEFSIAEQELVKKYFNNSLIIIDEVHNCTKESKTLSKQLKKLVKYADNLRLILLSATPMYNSPKEIIWITNLMNLNDRRTTIKYSDVFDEDGNLIQGKEDKGEQLLHRKLNGYISYVRGENPYTFPFRIYPSNPSEKQYNSLDNSEMVNMPMQGKLCLTEIGQEQKKVYKSVIQKSLNKGDGFWTTAGPGVPNFENMEKLGYNKLQAPLQSLIITFPGVHPYGKKGLENIMSYEKKDIKLGDAPKITIKCNYEYKSDIRIFSKTELRKYSAKISKVCECILASANKTVNIDGEQKTIHGGIIIVYTQYIYGGIVPMALALEEMGFLQYDSKNESKMSSLFKSGIINTRIDANTMVQKKKDEKIPGFKQAKYMIISGDKNFSQDNAEDIKVATSRANNYGEDVRVILISRAASEGLDFKNVRQVHVLDPWYNLNRTEQIIGRGVRNRSHCGLDFEERNTEIYMHVTTNEDQETADAYVYRYAEEKANKIGKVTRILKTVSVDCILNESQNNFTEEKMKEVADNGVVMIVPSTQTKLVEHTLGDKAFSQICDYMGDCDYKCYPKDNDDKYKESYDEMYDKEQINMNSILVVDKLKTLFKKENVYHIDTLKNMEIFKNTTPEELYYALTLLIDGPETIIDKNGRQGRLVNRDVYYIFQPQEVTSSNITFYESTIPVKTLNERIEYKIGEEGKEEGKEKEKEERKEEGKEEEKEEGKEDSYNNLLSKIEKYIFTATNENPTKLIEKVDNYNWYQHLNSTECIKETDKLKLFLNTNEIKKNDTDDDIQRKLSVELYKEYENLVCNTNEIISVMTRLKFLIGDETTIAKYVLHHILDTLSHNERLILAKKVVKSKPSNDLETRIQEYFKFLLLDSDTVIVLANKDKNIYYNIKDWTVNPYDYEFKGEMQKNMEVIKYSPIIGFVADNKDEMVFKRKDMTEPRNNSGAYLQNATNKADIVLKINNILETAKNGFRFDNETVSKAKRNTDGISKIAFAGIFELLIRKFNDNDKEKTWFLRPEQAIFNDIKNLNFDKIEKKLKL